MWTIIELSVNGRDYTFQFDPKVTSTVAVAVQFCEQKLEELEVNTQTAEKLSKTECEEKITQALDEQLNST